MDPTLFGLTLARNAIWASEAKPIYKRYKSHGYALVYFASLGDPGMTVTTTKNEDKILTKVELFDPIVLAYTRLSQFC